MKARFYVRRNKVGAWIVFSRENVDTKIVCKSRADARKTARELNLGKSSAPQQESTHVEQR